MSSQSHLPARIHFLEKRGLTLCTETFGAAEDPAILLIMGNSAPRLVWPDSFCWELAMQGFHVVRFDQRDTGLSSYIDFDTNPYTLNDLADDAFGVLEGLGIESAHIVGMSQGGLLAYRLGLCAPDRVRSITTLMSSIDLRPKNDAFLGLPPRADELPRPAPEYVAAVIALNAHSPVTEEESAKSFVENFRLAKGAASPFDEAFWLDMGRAIAAIPRLRRDQASAAVANHSNHSLAQIATPPLTTVQLSTLSVPVLIIHGDGDPIFPIAHAHASAKAIPGAKLLIIRGMGHALDLAFIRRLSVDIAAFASEVA